MDASFWITKLGLKPHPEGGYFRETYRAEGHIPSSALGSVVEGPRSHATLIFYLLNQGAFSAFHRIRWDEIWHYYAGNSAIRLHTISPEGLYGVWHLGNQNPHEEHFNRVIPGGTWFAAELVRPAGFALAGCTVAPGFDFRDFELAGPDLLTNNPAHRDVISRLLAKT